jgi:UDP-N-acetyl-D-mannosaminuronic acid transferase (WecB/TagA/CpsF family)
VEAKQAGGDAYILAKIVSVDAAARTYGISYSDRTKGTDVAETDIREATAEQKVFTC